MFYFRHEKQMYLKLMLIRNTLSIHSRTKLNIKQKALVY